MCNIETQHPQHRKIIFVTSNIMGLKTSRLNIYSI
jgi:hypothetical protein